MHRRGSSEKSCWVAQPTAHYNPAGRVSQAPRTAPHLLKHQVEAILLLKKLYQL